MINLTSAMRLNKRARDIDGAIYGRPNGKCTKSCQGWAETMAAYRFVDNGSIGWQAILAPHWQQTQHRMAAQPVVLCLRNATELDFNGNMLITTYHPHIDTMSKK